jgi:hypothetical protein
MKKLFLVLAVVAVYAFSVTAATASVVIAEKAQVTIVADDNNAPEAEKDAKKATKTEAKKADVKKAEAKGAACGETKAEAKEGCGTAEKKACCGEKK